jgi:hypothetical protein
MIDKSGGRIVAFAGTNGPMYGNEDKKICNAGFVAEAGIWKGDLHLGIQSHPEYERLKANTSKFFLALCKKFGFLKELGV